MARLTVFPTLIIFLVASPAAAENWPQWRGPQGNAHSAETGFARKWNADSLAWRCEIPGRGQSTPIVWNDRIFLTSADGEGAKRLVHCVDRASGKLLWSKVAWEGAPEKSHRMNRHASATCATDGERVIAFFGKGGIHCYDLAGKHQWTRDLGKFDGPWGTAASPIIVGDLVLQNCDAEDNARMMGLNKKTGKVVWSTPRETIRGFSSPILFNTGERQEAVINGDKTITSYDPATGKVLWTCKGSRGRGTPTLAPTKDFLVSVCGRSGEMVAVRPGGSGDVTKKREVWRVPRKGRDLPSPIIVGNHLLVCKLAGIMTCYDVRTGKELWVQRLDGRFTSSPVAAEGLVYMQSEAGKTYVIRPGAKYEEIAVNTLGSSADEIFRASITPSYGCLYIRSDHALYCVKPRAK